MKDPENKQRISIYVDRELVKKADELLSLAKCSSRNEFVAKAIERYIGELALGGGNSFVTKALADSIQIACADSLGGISTAMFRYAVYADMMVRLVASCMEVEPGELDEIQRQAYNNVRRTRGKILLRKRYGTQRSRRLRMTIKKLWKRICCLFHDDRTRLREGETLEDW